MHRVLSDNDREAGSAERGMSSGEKVNGLAESALDSILAFEPIADIAPSDGMFQGNRRHYFGVGRSAALSMVNALAARTQFINSEE